jgi:hypothetical protein
MVAMMVVTAAEPEAQKRHDPKAIPRIPIAVPGGYVSITRAIVVLIIFVIVIVAVAKAALLGRPVPTFFLTGPSLHVLN